MKYLINNSTDPHWNMAFDAFALESLRVDEPVFYLWQNAPAVIIGLNQSAYAEVNLPFLEAHGIILARRVTGGGAVYHDLGNLNYSIVGPAKVIEQHYGSIAASLREMGVPAELSGRNDILVEDRKCSGYAKRLYKDRMMIHGTLMWDVDLVRLTQALSVPGSKLESKGVASVRSRVANLKEYLPQFTDINAFRAALHDLLAEADERVDLSQEDLDSIGRLARDKFGTWDWNYGRSPQTTFQKTRKFPCGTITAHYSLKGGRFDQLSFTGDFLGSKPAEELAARLLGFHLEDIRDRDVSNYFEHLSTEEFLTLFQI